MWLQDFVAHHFDVDPELSVLGSSQERLKKVYWRKIRRPSDVKFFYGRQPEKLFAIPHKTPPLTDAMIGRIVHQVDARCRDVESKSYTPVSSIMSKEVS